jgi:hypothetical protein
MRACVGFVTPEHVESNPAATPPAIGFGAALTGILTSARRSWRGFLSGAEKTAESSERQEKGGKLSSKK